MSADKAKIIFLKYGSIGTIIVLAITLKVPTAVLLAYLDMEMGTFVCIYVLAWIVAIGALIGSFAAQANIDKQEEIKAKFKSPTPEKIVDMIDESASGSVMANSNLWLSKNWGALSDAEKIKWVNERKEALLRYLPTATNAPEFIVAMQKADKELIRKAS